MPRRVGRAAAEGRRASNQLLAQQRPSGRNAQLAHTIHEKLWLELERIWLPVAERCVAAGTLQALPLELLQQLQAALVPAVQCIQRVICRKQVYASAAQLLVLASHDWVRLEPQAGREVVRVIAVGLYSILRHASFISQSPNNLRAAVVSGELWAPRVAVRAQLLKLGVQQLAGAMLHTVSEAPGSGEGHSRTAQQQLTSAPASSVTMQQASAPSANSSSANGRALALDLCATYLLIMQGMLQYQPESATPAVAQRSLHWLDQSQLMNQVARMLISLGTPSSSNPMGDATPPATVSGQQPVPLAAAAATGQQQHSQQDASRAAAGSAGAATAAPQAATTSSMWSSSLQHNVQRLDYMLCLAIALAASYPWDDAADPEDTSEEERDIADPVADTLRFVGAQQYALPEVRGVLAAPGVQYYAAARMVQALCAVDGGTRWGMPELSLPNSDTHFDESRAAHTSEERAMEFAQLAGPVLLAGLLQRQLQPTTQQQEAPGAPGPAPVPPGGAFQIAVRALDWVLEGPGGARAAAAPAPRSLQMSRCKLTVAHSMLCLALVALRAGSPGKAASRLRRLLPLAAALLSRVCEVGADLSAPLIHMVVQLVLRVLHSAVRGSLAEDAWSAAAVGACMPAALHSGLLAALQAAAAWLTPERVAADPQQEEGSSVAVLAQFIAEGLPAWAVMADPPPTQQLAALVASLRCTAAGVLASLFGPCAEACSRSCWEVLQDLTGNMYNAVLGLLDCEAGASLPAAIGPLATFTLVHLTPCMQRGVVAMTLAAAERGQLRALKEAWRMALMPIAFAAKACELAATEPGAGQDAGDGASGGSCSSATAPAAQGGGNGSSRAARVASWRRVLLRELRALDTLGLLMRFAAKHADVGRENVRVVLAALQAVARAVPQDLQRHLAAARAQRRPGDLTESAIQYVEADLAGASASTQPAGWSLAALRLDEAAVPLLAEGRFDAVELPGLLKGQQVGDFDAERELLDTWGTQAATQLPAPCEVAALLPVCENPGCTAQAYYAGAVRGSQLPALLACPKCGQARYCSRACQKAHWGQYHKAECGKRWWGPSG